jgi:peroxiredoxin
VTDPIAQHVADLTAGLSAVLPPEAIDAFAAEQAELAEAGRPDGLVPVGTRLPDEDLLDPHGQTTTLYAVTGDRPSVLVFYRGVWSPYCAVTLRTYQTDLLPALTELGVGLVAISPQVTEGSLAMREKNDLTFAVLSDPGNILARAVGVLTAPTMQARAAQFAIGTDLTELNEDHTASIPMPTTVILDADRVVRWVDVHPDYTTRSEPADILVALDKTVGTAR